MTRRVLPNRFIDSFCPTLWEFFSRKINIVKLTIRVSSFFSVLMLRSICQGWAQSILHLPKKNSYIPSLNYTAHRKLEYPYENWFQREKFYWMSLFIQAEIKRPCLLKKYISQINCGTCMTKDKGIPYLDFQFLFSKFNIECRQWSNVNLDLNPTIFSVSNWFCLMISVSSCFWLR